MPYQKTAKDKAWDAQRAKLKAQVSMWENNYNVERAKNESLVRKNQELTERIHDLEQAIAYLTEGKATPEEVLKKLDKNAELASMLQFMVKSMPGGYF